MARTDYPSTSQGWDIPLGDVSTAFLHTELPEGEEIYVQPEEYYTDTNIVWNLKRPYTDKASPRHWQAHFAGVLEKLGADRLKPDSNVYYFREPKTIVMVYVDDVLVVGEQVDTVFKLWLN